MGSVYTNLPPGSPKEGPGAPLWPVSSGLAPAWLDAAVLRSATLLPFHSFMGPSRFAAAAPPLWNRRAAAAVATATAGKGGGSGLGVRRRL